MPSRAGSRCSTSLTAGGWSCSSWLSWLRTSSALVARPSVTRLSALPLRQRGTPGTGSGRARWAHTGDGAAEQGRRRQTPPAGEGRDERRGPDRHEDSRRQCPLLRRRGAWRLTAPGGASGSTGFRVPTASIHDARAVPDPAGRRPGAGTAQPTPGAHQAPPPRLRPHRPRPDASGSMALLRTHPGGRRPGIRLPRQSTATRAKRAWPRVDVQVTAQHVASRGCPTTPPARAARAWARCTSNRAGGSTNPQQLWLRYANVRSSKCCPASTCRSAAWRTPPARRRQRGPADRDLEASAPRFAHRRRVRMVPLSARLRRRRADGRMAREGHRPRGPMPTQGGFARVAGPTIDDIDVAGATVSVRPTTRLAHTQLQGFVLVGTTTRRVTQRPDNTASRPRAPTSGSRARRHATSASTRPARVTRTCSAGGVVQTGDWYGQDHAPNAVALEAGYQWTRAPWAPWVRAGLLHACGDDTAADDRHGTYFPVLPTVRRFSQTTWSRP